MSFIPQSALAENTASGRHHPLLNSGAVAVVFLHLRSSSPSDDAGYGDYGRVAAFPQGAEAWGKTVRHLQNKPQEKVISRYTNSGIL